MKGDGRNAADERNAGDERGRSDGERQTVSRRQAIGALAAAALAPGLASTGQAGILRFAHDDSRTQKASRAPDAGRAPRLKQSVSRWCYGRIPLDDLCDAAKRIGYQSVELLDEKDWPVVASHGLVCAMANGFGPIGVGFNDPANHDRLVADGAAMIPKAAAAGVPNIVCFSGNRRGRSDADGIANCIAGFKRLTPAAEQHGVTLCLEVLNSKVDHKDYHADHTAWAVKVIEGVASPRLKILYDIYHMQIMEGDVIATLKANIAHIAHVHTGGVPGRAEIDETQELNYRAVMQALAGLGFTGYVGQEFVPRRDPLTSLEQAFGICDV